MIATPSSLPKVVLHDHLDGGLRPATLEELADRAGYAGLGERSAEEVFADGASGSLEEYLEAFVHTLAVLQSPDNLRRAAAEAVVDHAVAGVEYAEIRFAPSLHRAEGLTREQAIEHVLEGLSVGEQDTGITARLIICAMRQDDDSDEVAAAAVQYRDAGVVGFDLAGPEAGFSPELHLTALEQAESAGLRLTIHAGEGDGVASISAALDCGAERIGHGVRLAEDIGTDGDSLGAVALRVREAGTALEICPTSEVHTKAVSSAAAHPASQLHRMGFAVTVNTDNRLMSHTDMGREFDFLAEHGFGIADLKAVTMQGLDAAFCDDETKEMVRSRIEEAYDRLI